MTADQYWMLIYKPVKLVLKIIHHDKAGETGTHYVVDAEVADVDAEGVALLVTRDGLPVIMPVDSLYAVDATEDRDFAAAYLAGHELVRVFHPHADEPRTVRRWLDRPEIEALLNAE